jgi:hypothetical protein
VTEAATARSARDLATLNEPWVEFFFLADRAEAVNGKLYAMGGAWDRVGVTDFKQPVAMSLAVSVMVPWNATNAPHSIEITLEDLDRNQPIQFNVKAEFTQGRPAWARPGDAQRVILTVPALGVVLPGAGSYQAVAKVDGQEPGARYPFSALAMQQAGLPGR